MDSNDPYCAAVACTVAATTRRRPLPASLINDKLLKTLLSDESAPQRAAAAAYALQSTATALPGHWQPLDWGWLEGLLRRVGSECRVDLSSRLQSYTAALDLTADALRSAAATASGSSSSSSSLPLVLNGAPSLEAAVKRSLQHTVSAWKRWGGGRATAAALSSQDTAAADTAAMRGCACRAAAKLTGLITLLLVKAAAARPQQVGQWCLDALVPLSSAEPLLLHELLCYWQGHGLLPAALPQQLLNCLPRDIGSGSGSSSRRGSSSSSSEEVRQTLVLKRYLERAAGVRTGTTEEQPQSGAQMLHDLLQQG
jgi:hypothetical protein